MNHYPTDQELEQWIEQLEQEELYAPKHLKDEIIFRARQASNAESFSVEKKKAAKRKEFIIYSMKIIGSMAAVLMILFTVPTDYKISEKSLEMNMEKYEEQDSLTDKMKNKVSEVSDWSLGLYNKINDITNSITLEGLFYED